jgi:hypothetical protein
MGSLVAANRAPDRSTELVVSKWVLRLPGRIGKETRRVYLVISEEFEQRSMPLVRTGLRLQVDDSPRDISKLGGVRSRLDGEFAHSFEGNIKTVAAPLRRGSSRDPVDQVQVGL